MIRRSTGQAPNQKRSPAVQILPVGLPRTAALPVANGGHQPVRSGGDWERNLFGIKNRKLKLADRDVSGETSAADLRGAYYSSCLDGDLATAASNIIRNRKIPSHPRRSRPNTQIDEAHSGERLISPGHINVAFIEREEGSALAAIIAFRLQLV